ncbi:MAG: enoyl-CoA hydratase-related protein [Sulfitobacter sp.]
MSTNLLLIEDIGPVTRITLNAPASMNAVSTAMAMELRLAVRAAAQRSGAIVLTGDDRAFSSGANLSNDPGMAVGEMDAGTLLEDLYNPLALTIRDCPVPIVTAVRGAAAGVGASLAMMGDIIVAGRSAYFLMPFRHIGLVPDGGAAWLLTRAIGRTRALEMMLLGEKLPAEKALDWGLITRLTEDDAVLETAEKLAKNLALGATKALALTRQLTWAAQSSSFEEELRSESAAQREAGYHPDFVEGVTAFQEKRRPKFQ